MIYMTADQVDLHCPMSMYVYQVKIALEGEVGAESETTPTNDATDGQSSVIFVFAFVSYL